LPTACLQAAPSRTPPFRQRRPCYFRADVGYSWSSNPDVRWTVTDPNTFQFVTDA
jgi:hypothetical protein